MGPETLGGRGNRIYIQHQCAARSDLGRQARNPMSSEARSNVVETRKGSNVLHSECRKVMILIYSHAIRRRRGRAPTFFFGKVLVAIREY